MLPGMKHPQDIDVRTTDLVTHFVMLDEHPPDLAIAEACEPFT